jgi:hypothetical protein
MSDGHGVIGPIIQALDPGYDQLSFQRKGEWRAGFGAFVLTATLYAGATLDLAALPNAQLIGGICVAGGALLFVITGLRDARTPRDILLMLWFGVVTPGGCWWLVTSYAPWLWIHSYYGRGFLIAAGASWAVEFFINARGIGGGNARRLVDKQIAASAIKWTRV